MSQIAPFLHNFLPPKLRRVNLQCVATIQPLFSYFGMFQVKIDLIAIFVYGLSQSMQRCRAKTMNLGGRVFLGLASSILSSKICAPRPPVQSYQPYLNTSHALSVYMFIFLSFYLNADITPIFVCIHLLQQAIGKSFGLLGQASL